MTIRQLPMPLVVAVCSWTLVGMSWLSCRVAAADDKPGPSLLAWNGLPPFPNELGVAGPLVGVHNNVLVVGGGADGSLYMASGIASCFIVGYIVSLLLAKEVRDLTGLTVYTLPEADQF